MFRIKISSFILFRPRYFVSVTNSANTGTHAWALRRNWRQTGRWRAVGWALWLRPAPVHSYVSLQTVSDELGIGLSHLTEVCQQFNEAGLLTSKRGRGAGIVLTRAPYTISLYDVVVAINGDNLFEECVLGLAGRGEAEPCPLHDHWTDERERMRRTFQDTTLAAVPNVRLTPFVEASRESSGDALS